MSSISTDYDSSLRPKVGDTDVGIPVTIDYSGGRFQANKARLLWTIVSLFGILVVAIGILLSDTNFFVKIIIDILFIAVSTTAVRYLLLKEHKYRAEMVNRQENDLRIRAANFWGIYRISENDYCYFRNGWVGLFVMLEKAPIVGKTEKDKFDHYEAIADAYNLLATSKLRVCHIDMMDFIGRDNRTQRAMMKLAQNDNEDMRFLLDKIFKNLQDIAESSVTSYDIYLFMSKTDEEDFESELSDVLACFLDANYSTYEILNKEQIKTIAQALFNLNDFSINDAVRQAFRKESSKASIVPINLERDGNVVEVFNKTLAEKKADLEQAAALRKEVEKERIRKRNEARAAKKKGKSSPPKERIGVKTPETAIDFGTINPEGIDISLPGATPADFHSPHAEEDFDDSIDPFAETSDFINDASTGAFLDDSDELEPVSEDTFMDFLKLGGGVEGTGDVVSEGVVGESKGAHRAKSVSSKDETFDFTL